MRLSALHFRHYVSILAVGLAILFAVADHADARRAWAAFRKPWNAYLSGAPRDSRGADAGSPHPAFNDASASGQPDGPGPASGVAPRPGLFSGSGGSLLGGLLVGGLLGHRLGHGFGGAFGFLGMLLQMDWSSARLRWSCASFRARQAQLRWPAAPAERGMFDGLEAWPVVPQHFTEGSSLGVPQTDEIGLTQQDLDTFDVFSARFQTGYGREDYAALRERTTPEAMSYLAEELGENATRGVRNSVTDVRLLQGNVAEAWREGNIDYATLAMRYSSIDATLDRASGKVVDGDPKNPTEATEVWTFARKDQSDWKLRQSSRRKSPRLPARPGARAHRASSACINLGNAWTTGIATGRWPSPSTVPDLPTRRLCAPHSRSPL